VVVAHPAAERLGVAQRAAQRVGGDEVLRGGVVRPGVVCQLRRVHVADGFGLVIGLGDGGGRQAERRDVVHQGHGRLRHGMPARTGPDSRVQTASRVASGKRMPRP